MNSASASESAHGLNRRRLVSIKMSLCICQRLPTRICHKPQLLQFRAARTVERGPVAAFSAWRNPLREPAVGHFLQRGVNPAEAQAFLNNFKVWNGTRPRRFAAVTCHPGMTGRCMMGRQPLPKLPPARKIQKRLNCHCGISLMALMILPHRMPSRLAEKYAAVVKVSMPATWMFALETPACSSSH